jgi:bla regulator protein BlaR1
MMDRTNLDTRATRALILAIVGLAFSAQPAACQTPAWQTAAGGKMSFEVVSIKPSRPGTFTPPNFPLDASDAYESTGGRFSADFPLSIYITFAYKLDLTREQTESMLAHLPKWASTDKFTIQSKAEGNRTKDQMRLMVQSLLADRFKLVAHFETEQVPIFALTLAKPGKLGPNLRPHADGPPCDGSGGDPEVFPEVCDVYALEGKGGRELGGSRNTTMDLLAGSLSGFGRLGRHVVNQTGLTGRFDFKLEWTPEAPDAEGPTFLQALREQLGLKLESTRGPIQTLVIDHVDRPSEN